MISRRDLLRSAIAVALASCFAAARALEKPAAERKLTVLIIGTDFVATHVAEVARRRGHTVSLLNRATRKNMAILKDEHDVELSIAEGQKWDAVIDTDARVPVHVAGLPPALVSGAGYYLLISGTSVYAKLDKPGVDESAPVQKTTEPEAQKATNATASALRALCETVAEKTMPGRVCVLRPGLIVGPGDPTGRFTYWPVRVARGGDVLAPGKPTDFVQFIDVRDLADFIVLCTERKILGTFNTDGEGGAMTIGTLLETCKKVANSDAKLVWADSVFLAQHRISFYRDMPVWAPASGDYIGFGRISSAKAKGVGLKYRPLTQTVKDTLAWFHEDPAAARTLLKAGLTPKREVDALKALRARKT